MTDINAIVTRFDVFDRAATEDMDEFTALRLFNKRKLVGEIDVAEIVRWEGELDEVAFGEWIKAADRTVGEAMDYLGEEDEIEDEDGEESEGGSVVPDKYRERYGSAQNCGDAMAIALTGYVTLARVTRKNPDGGLDRDRLREVAIVNGLDDKLNNWEERGLNGGLLRMNLSNVMRGMIRRGLEVRVNQTVFKITPEPKAKKGKGK